MLFAQLIGMSLIRAVRVAGRGDMALVNDDNKEQRVDTYSPRIYILIVKRVYYINSIIPDPAMR